MLVNCNAELLTITVDDAQRVSGLLQVPVGARICFVLAHGAGAGMSHPFMAGVADGLAERGIATMRYQFPYWPDAQTCPGHRPGGSQSSLTFGT